MKSYTDLEQSKKLAEFLPLESADMWYHGHYSPWESERKYDNEPCSFHSTSPNWDKPCWSLAALLEYMNRNFYNISLNYCGSEYTISFDDGEIYKTITKDYSIDAAFEMICWLKENGKI